MKKTFSLLLGVLVFAFFVCAEETATDASSSVQRIDINPLIIGGTPTLKGQYPWFISVGPFASFICGGALIAPDIFVSAAHCSGVFARGAIVGSNELYESSSNITYLVDIVAEVVHPNFTSSPFTGTNDIMVLKISPPVTTLPVIRVNSDPNIPIDDASMQVMGYGLDANPIDGGAVQYTLMEAEVLKTNATACNRISNGGPDIILCGLNTAPLRLSCKGDSGGPLVDNDSGSLVGIVSFGVSGTCTSGDPSGYTRISAFFDWIDEQVCSLSDSPPAGFSCHVAPSSVPSTTPTISPTHSLCGTKKAVCGKKKACCSNFFCYSQKCRKCKKKKRPCFKSDQCCSSKCKKGKCRGMR
jgi:trypsin